MPAYTSSSRGVDVHLEIAQTGQGNTLDAQESWVKYYIDPDRAYDATIGIYAGGYGDEVDTLGTSRGNNGQRLSDPGAVSYDFYLAEDFAFQRADGTPYDGELPCREGGQLSSSLTVKSNIMPVDGWYKIDATRFKDNARCNNKGWHVTKKSNRLVLFMRATWNTYPPTVGGQVQGRVNAFKAGAAYANSTGFYDSPITGYWADFASAVLTDGTPQRAAYSVQDRRGAQNTNGSYTFTFAPDCGLAPGKQEKRYLHWKDVDYPLYYQAPYPVQPPPEFELVEIPPGQSNGSVVLRRGPGDNMYNGSSQNVHHSVAYNNFKGGYTYKWVWKNVARVDGVSFWIPYDDFTALAGCGNWDHDLTMKAGVKGYGLGTTEFKVAGGQSVRINLNQFAKGETAGPETEAQAVVTAANNVSIATTFEQVSSSLGGTDIAYGANARVVGWKNLGRLGPAPVYDSSRTDIYTDFKVRENAPDGARYCVTSSMTPKSNTNPAGFASKPSQICFEVDNSLKPYLTTEDGDVHAGNDCIIAPGGARLPQTVKGQVIPGITKGSYATYVVSAGDQISQFGSAGWAEFTSLRFGKTGYYGSICRPSLAALNAELNRGGFTEIAGDSATPFNLNSLAAGGRYVVRFKGSATILGKAKAPVTIISDNTVSLGGAEVGSDTTTAAARKSLPVVGVIAKDIKIRREVGTISAQLYATGNIDTCSDFTAFTCRSSLTLRGFAMANTFNFKRSGTGSSNLQLGELFSFSGAFYLNPPPGFGSPAGTVKYLGERAPLY